MLSFKEFHERTPNQFNVGDRVRNCNPECEHYGSTGIVIKLLDLKDPEYPDNVVGKAVKYKCDCCGDSWQKGEELEKTTDQLEKI